MSSSQNLDVTSQSNPVNNVVFKENDNDDSSFCSSHKNSDQSDEGSQFIADEERDNMSIIDNGNDNDNDNEDVVILTQEGATLGGNYYSHLDSEDGMLLTQCVNYDNDNSDNDDDDNYSASEQDDEKHYDIKNDGHSTTAHEHNEKSTKEQLNTDDDISNIIHETNTKSDSRQKETIVQVGLDESGFTEEESCEEGESRNEEDIKLKRNQHDHIKHSEDERGSRSENNLMKDQSANDAKSIGDENEYKDTNQLKHAHAEKISDIVAQYGDDLEGAGFTENTQDSLTIIEDYTQDNATSMEVMETINTKSYKSTSSSNTLQQHTMPKKTTEQMSTEREESQKSVLTTEEKRSAQCDEKDGKHKIDFSMTMTPMVVYNGDTQSLQSQTLQINLSNLSDHEVCKEGESKLPTTSNSSIDKDDEGTALWEDETQTFNPDNLNAATTSKNYDEKPSQEEKSDDSEEITNRLSQQESNTSTFIIENTPLQSDEFNYCPEISQLMSKEIVEKPLVELKKSSAEMKKLHPKEDITEINMEKNSCESFNEKQDKFNDRDTIAEAKFPKSNKEMMSLSSQVQAQKILPVQLEKINRNVSSTSSSTPQKSVKEDIKNTDTPSHKSSPSSRVTDDLVDSEVEEESQKNRFNVKPKNGKKYTFLPPSPGKRNDDITNRNSSSRPNKDTNNIWFESARMALKKIRIQENIYDEESDEEYRPTTQNSDDIEQKHDYDTEENEHADGNNYEEHRRSDLKRGNTEVTFDEENCELKEKRRRPRHKVQICEYSDADDELHGNEVDGNHLNNDDEEYRINDEEEHQSDDEEEHQSDNEEEHQSDDEEEYQSDDEEDHQCDDDDDDYDAEINYIDTTQSQSTRDIKSQLFKLKRMNVKKLKDQLMKSPVHSSKATRKKIEKLTKQNKLLTKSNKKFARDNKKMKMKVSSITAKLKEKKNLCAEMKSQLDQLQSLLEVVQKIGFEGENNRNKQKRKKSASSKGVCGTTRADTSPHLETDRGSNDEAQETPRKKLAYHSPKSGKKSLGLVSSSPRKRKKVQRSKGNVTFKDLWKQLQENGWKYRAGPEPYGSVYVPPGGSVRRGAKLGKDFYHADDELWKQAEELGIIDKVSNSDDEDNDKRYCENIGIDKSDEYTMVKSIQRANFRHDKSTALISSPESDVDANQPKKQKNPYLFDNSGLSGPSGVLTKSSAYICSSIMANFLQTDFKKKNFTRDLWIPLWNCIKSNQGSNMVGLGWRYEKSRGAGVLGRDYWYCPPNSSKGSKGDYGKDYFTTETAVVAYLLREIKHFKCSLPIDEVSAESLEMFEVKLSRAIEDITSFDELTDVSSSGKTKRRPRKKMKI